ncbi:FAD-dependent 5-carboxymethylaminomethyl-2-thiouridine(34) oxidoreductase MnmC [Alcaligenaceae bacterium]|nr:FAD-dependent 5-carboxymethylaminomethyl-2-thiouridine(34) oxidoreductase MnmC [Alcaligenaceae bacterium]
MRFQREPLRPASLVFNEQGVPASTLYGDVYHARAGALDQARHVFIGGNGLPGRWSGRDTFTVCETGFGLGHNFLALWQAWRDAPGRPRHLHFLSFEAHPFSAGDLAAALAGHAGELRGMADALVRAWPPLLPGLHRLEFEEGRLTLTLAFGSVEYLARQAEAGVDAFFLDGFAPRLNPAMWSRELFGQLVRIANAGATAASWCCAGQVRRDLAAAGFLVSRAPGFGGKRQMSRAVLRPGLGRMAAPPRRDAVIVVGGGLAGAGMAHSLALRGHAVTVLDPAFARGPAGGHEGHRCAAMTPALSRDDNPMSRLSRAGILLAGLRWKGLPGVHEACGSLVRVAAAEAGPWQSALEALRLPPEWASWCPAAETAARTGWPLSTGGVWLGAGALLRPARLVAALLAHDGITVCARRVGRLNERGGIWRALSDEGAVLAEAPRAVIAAAADAPALLAAAMPDAGFPKLARMQRMGGQVAHFRAAALGRGTRSIVAGAGYWLPQDEGVHVGGSTYVFDPGLAAGRPSDAGFREVALKVAGLLETGPEALMSARAAPDDGWAGWRAAVSDHLPVIGPADARRSLWLACAYGSRGLSWMTLAGEIMAATLGAEPLPLERELLKAVRPR